MDNNTDRANDFLRCKACGTALHKVETDTADEPVSDKPNPTARKRRTTPQMLRYKTTRLSTRVSMLAAIPGLGMVRAQAIVRKYPTFTALMAAQPDDLSKIVIKFSPLGSDLALAVRRVVK